MVPTVKLCKLPVACVMVLLAILCGCQGLVNGSRGSGNIQAVNHIIFMVQENRSFDTYFGQLPAYWQANGFPGQQFDGIPTNASKPSYDGTSMVPAFHVATECTQNLSPSWNESHVDWNRTSPTSSTATMDGFVYNAAVYAQNAPKDEAPIYDTAGVRAMGYYDASDLNYYYFMASNFATSDRWFSPVMTRTHPNREFMISGTSQGRVYPNGTDAQDTGYLTAKTIFEELQAAGITWKIYVDPLGSPCQSNPTAACLMGLSYLHEFAYSQTVLAQYPQNIAPISQYFTDLANGTLPQVAQIEPNTDGGFDEHPATSDTAPTDVQYGANYISGLINPLMQSPSWKDSAFILTYDEYGGLSDHVQPQP